MKSVLILIAVDHLATNCTQLEVPFSLNTK